jgi:hypothetical protein
MNISLRKITTIGLSAAMLGGAGIGAAQAAQTATSSSSSSTTRPAHKRGGGLTSAQLQRIAAKLGVSSAQLKTALDANRPAKPAAGKKDGFAADLATALGVDKAKVQTILDANRPAKPAAGTKPTKPDHSALVTALASGLNLDESVVRAALDKLDAAHKADRGDHFAAIAKSLGLETADVKAAFDAERPAKPAR